MKVSIKWIEVLLIALIAIAALAIWTETDRQLGIQMKDSEPNEIEIQQNHGVQSTQVDLAAQQKRLDALQDRLSDRQAEQITQANDLYSLTKTYPQLAVLPISDTSVAPLVVIQAYVQARNELSETTFLVNHLTTDFTAGVNTTIDLSNTLKNMSNSYRRQALEAQLAAAQTLRDSLQKSLIEAQIKLPVLVAKIAALEAEYPQLAQLTPEQQIAAALPVDVVKAYVDAQLKQSALDAEITALTDHTKVQQALVVSQTIILAQAQRKAGQETAVQQDGFSLLKRLFTLGISLVGLIVVLCLAYALIVVASNTELAPGWKIVLSATVALVLILLGFQAFQVLGAVVMATIVLLVLFVAIARP